MPISQNQALFSILGTTNGGDGRTTFGLPDLRGRVPMHAGNGPGLSPRCLGEKGGGESASSDKEVKVDKAVRASQITIKSGDGNMPPYQVVNYIICLRGIYSSRN